MKQFDRIDILLFIMFFFLGVFLCIYVYNCSKHEEEKSCVEFYNKNNYVLDSCEIYRDKLEG